MKKIAITGVGGFVGSHVYNYFKSAGYEILLISSSHKVIEENETLSLDTLKSDDLVGVDVIVHCAGIAHRKDSHDMAAFNEYFEFNSLKTIDLFNKCKNANVKRFIYLSSANVCRPIDNIVSSASELLPLDINSFSKVVSERMIQLSADNNIDFTIIRCPLVYGVGVKGNFSTMMKLVDKAKILPFGCFGNVKKSMVSIYNLLDLINVCAVNPKAANQIFMISDEDDVSVLELTRTLATLKGKRIFMLPIPISLLSFLGLLVGKRKLMKNISMNFRLDIDHTTRTLGWHPPYGLEQSLSKFINKKQ
ncbi:MAG: UDP-glucose 4-epimerase [Arenicella sp.]|jgi:UDP-glucose 4-epimerase